MNLLFLIFFVILYQFNIAQNYLPIGMIPEKSILIGIETGGNVTHIEANYSLTGKDEWTYNIRTVPKISFFPIKNLAFGTYFSYEYLKNPQISFRKNTGIGFFSRYYLPFINKLLKINKSKFLDDRIFIFSEIYLELNNYILNEDGNTGSSERLNTIFYGFKAGIDFRVYKMLCLEIAYVQNFDNRNGDFKIFHPEIGLEYLINLNRLNTK